MASERGGRREPNRDREYSRNKGQNQTRNRNDKNPKAGARSSYKPEPESGLLDSVLGAVFSVVIGISDFFKKMSGSKNNNYFKIVFGLIGVIIIFFAGFFIYRSATKINAQVVYLDEMKIGTIKIPKDGEIEASYIEELAINKIVEDVGSEILVNEKVTVESVHAKEKFVEPDYVISEIAKKYTYKISAAEITVDGVKMATVASEAVAKEILDGITNSYRQSTLNITSATFVEDVKTTPVYVDKGDIISKDAAHNILTASSKAEKTYEIKQGDTPGKIAADADMTLEELMKINPDIEPTKLKIGGKLNLVVSKPVLSVKTLERVTYREVIPKTIQKNLINTQKKGYEKIIQQGKDGEQEVTADIIRINGYEEKERDIIDKKIIVAPITEIIEVGTQ